MKFQWVWKLVIFLYDSLEKIDADFEMIKLTFFRLKLDFKCHNQVRCDVFRRYQPILRSGLIIAKMGYMEKKWIFAPVCSNCFCKKTWTRSSLYCSDLVFWTRKELYETWMMMIQRPSSFSVSQQWLINHFSVTADFFREIRKAFFFYALEVQNQFCLKSFLVS